MHYLGFDGDTPVSTSAMHLTDGVAWFGYGGTLDAFRGRGWQSAMFARRLQDARDLGCRLAITETGEETEKIPVNHSYRNMVRVAWAPCSTRRRPASLGLARDRQAVTSGTGGCDNASQDQTYQQPGPAKPVGIARDIGRHEGAACQRSFR